MRGQQRFEWRRLVVRDAHLTDATRRVLMELESYADPEGNNAHPGVQRIAEQLRTAEGKTGHVSDRTVRTALATGVDRGFIELVRKAPRGRGVRFADVYRLTVPGGDSQDVGSLPETVRPATAIAGNTGPDIAAVQIAAIADRNTGNQAQEYRQFDPEIPATAIAEHQILTTRSLPPDPPSSLVSNADARDDNRFTSEWMDGGRRSATDVEADPEPREVVVTPHVTGIDTIEVLDSRANPLEWIEREIPQGFLTGERSRARDLLASGMDAGSVRFALIRERAQNRKRRTA